MNRLFFGIIGLILTVIIIIAVLIGGGKKTQNPATKPLTLPDYASTDATVSLTIDGSVNGDDTHRAIRVTVGREARTLQVIQGYGGNVIQSNRFENNQPAYEVFLRAINGGGFMSKLKNPKVSSDERGQCPLGFRYIFALSQNGYDLSRAWASSCSKSIGTSAANPALLQTLFKAQITDYDTLTNNVQL